MLVVNYCLCCVESSELSSLPGLQVLQSCRRSLPVSRS